MAPLKPQLLLLASPLPVIHTVQEVAQVQLLLTMMSVEDYQLNSTLKCVTAYPQGTNEQNKYCLAHQFDEDQYYAIAS